VKVDLELTPLRQALLLALGVTGRRPRGPWTCPAPSSALGRPLRVDGATRTAAPVLRGDWRADLGLEVDAPPAVAAALAAHWAGVAALEHASVASFARFTLELMALGAPPDLLVMAQQAALDEVQHARLAWSVASLWAGRPVGPGPLDVAGVSDARALADVVAALVHEGCVGETLGAAEARMLATLAEHPLLAALLGRVAEDEQRHAALAWRTLAWLLAHHGERARVAALTAAALAEAELRAADPEDDARVLAPGWGLVAAATRRACHRKTFAEVVRPVLTAVLGRSAVA
jgi:hypothetical protein